MPRRFDRAVLLGLILLEAIWIAPLFRGFEPFGDDLSIHLAEIASLSRSLAAGDFNLWNPSANGGFASGYFYQLLPQLIPTLLHLGLRLPLLLAFKIAITASLMLLPLAAYRGLVVAGVPSERATGAALALGLVCSTFGWGLGADSMFSTGIYTQAWALLFYPLALGYSARYLSSGRHLFRAALYALLTGLCHPFIAIALAPALLLLPGRFTQDGLRRRVTLLLVVIALSAFFWLPILIDYQAFGGFPARIAGEEGLRAAELWTAVRGGGLVDGGRWPILCTLGLLGIGAALGRRLRRSAPSPADWFAWQAVVFGALIVAGPSLGKTPDDLFPAIRFLAPLQLALAVAGGAWAVEALEWARFRDRPAGRALLTLAFGLSIFLAVDHKSSSMRERVRTLGAKDFQRDELEEIIGFLRSQPPGRVLGASEAGTGTHWWMHLPWVEAGQPALRAYGGAALQSSGNYRYLRTLRAVDFAWLYDLRYLLMMKEAYFPVAGARLTFETPRALVFELPAAGMITAVELDGQIRRARPERDASTASWLQSGSPEGHTVALIGQSAPRGGGLGRVLEQSEAPSAYAAEVEVEGGAPAAFLLRATYHPRWSFTIDGVPAATLHVAPDFMAVMVAPGRHRIEAQFSRPPASWLLLFGTLAGLCALAALERRPLMRRAAARGSSIRDPDARADRAQRPDAALRFL